jgi:catechol 2,3-dioxygenase-like lactoylglutathione lyase family enzyme
VQLKNGDFHGVQAKSEIYRKINILNFSSTLRVIMAAKLQKLSPILWTKDLNKTIFFYTTILGFTGQSNFPDFVTLTRNDVEIMFIVPKDDTEECPDPGNEDFFQKPILTGSLFIVVENVDELWEAVREKVQVKTSIANREYLMRDFSILDNNGYELVFGQDISRRASVN